MPIPRARIPNFRYDAPRPAHLGPAGSAPPPPFRGRGRRPHRPGRRGH
jgi:hypothetical protein